MTETSRLETVLNRLLRIQLELLSELERVEAGIRIYCEASDIQKQALLDILNDHRRTLTGDIPRRVSEFRSARGNRDLILENAKNLIKFFNNMAKVIDQFIKDVSRMCILREGDQLFKKILSNKSAYYESLPIEIRQWLINPFDEWTKKTIIEQTILAGLPEMADEFNLDIGFAQTRKGDASPMHVVKRVVAPSAEHGRKSLPPRYIPGEEKSQILPNQKTVYYCIAARKKEQLLEDYSYRVRSIIREETRFFGWTELVEVIRTTATVIISSSSDYLIEYDEEGRPVLRKKIKDYSEAAVSLSIRVLRIIIKLFDTFMTAKTETLFSIVGLAKISWEYYQGGFVGFAERFSSYTTALLSLCVMKKTFTTIKGYTGIVGTLYDIVFSGSVITNYVFSSGGGETIGEKLYENSIPALVVTHALDYLRDFLCENSPALKAASLLYKVVAGEKTLEEWKKEIIEMIPGVTVGCSNDQFPLIENISEQIASQQMSQSYMGALPPLHIDMTNEKTYEVIVMHAFYHDRPYLNERVPVVIPLFNYPGQYTKKFRYSTFVIGDRDDTLYELNLENSSIDWQVSAPFVGSASVIAFGFRPGNIYRISDTKNIISDILFRVEETAEWSPVRELITGTPTPMKYVPVGRQEAALKKYIVALESAKSFQEKKEKLLLFEKIRKKVPMIGRTLMALTIFLSAAITRKQINL